MRKTIAELARVRADLDVISSVLIAARFHWHKRVRFTHARNLLSFRDSKHIGNFGSSATIQRNLRMISQIFFAVLTSVVAINSQLVSGTGDPILIGKALQPTLFSQYTKQLVYLHGFSINIMEHNALYAWQVL